MCYLANNSPAKDVHSAYQVRVKTVSPGSASTLLLGACLASVRPCTRSEGAQPARGAGPRPEPTTAYFPAPSSGLLPLDDCPHSLLANPCSAQVCAQHRVFNGAALQPLTQFGRVVVTCAGAIYRVSNNGEVTNHFSSAREAD